MLSQALVLPLEKVGIADIPTVGGKNASLGEMIQQLKSKGVKVPTGFATTANAYRYFMQTAGIEPQLRQIFADLDVEDVNNLWQRGKQARSLMLQTPFPQELEQAIAQAYQDLCQKYGADTDVVVRSSATAEDLPDASFAGQQETYLNVHGLQAVLETCHKCFASIFTDRAISYRQIKGFDHFSIALSVGVQKMVRSDLAASGVMFSIDTETGFKDAALIAQGIGAIAAAFYPKPVIVRLSDFKSNEYANLLGGKQFEPQEENPMIGWRGASRYYDERYREGFALECRAMKKVREEMGLINVILMVPFCRTPAEGRRVLAEMAGEEWFSKGRKRFTSVCDVRVTE